MSNPFVSIIIPVFNGEPYIVDCLNSIKDQDYQNYEIIIIDDGSSDNSLERCKEFFFNHSNLRIRIYSQKNSGVARARNLGIKKTSANSNYIFFIDCDDIVAPNYLSSGIKNAKENNLVILGFEKFDKQPKNILEDNSLKSYNEIHYDIWIYDEYWASEDFLLNLQKGIICSCWAKCYSLDLIRRHNIQFQDTYPEDTLFNLDYLEYCNQIVYSPIPVYGYRQTPGSITSKPYVELYDNYLHIQKRLYEKVGVNTKYIDKFVYPQYRANTVAFLRKNDLTIPRHYLKDKYIKKAFSSYVPSNHKDWLLHTIIRFRFLKLAQFLVCRFL